MASESNSDDYDVDATNYFMQQALHVAKSALDIGEVPVGCVIVLRDALQDESTRFTDPSPRAKQDLDNTDINESFYKSLQSVIISHGANQVNATRDATRHAEIVAIDRMLTRGRSSDQLKLPPAVICKSAHGKIPRGYSPGNDHWINIKSNKDHWKNGFGWGSGRTFDAEVLQRCDLYVTCEPCIMVSDFSIE